MLLALFGCTNKEPEKSKDFTIPKFVNKRPIRVKTKYPPGWLKKISINISKNSSVKEGLSKLASSVSVDLNLEGIEDVTGITYSATNISFLRALKTICGLCGWRIKINNGGDISVLKDINYFYTHEVSFLLHMRKMKLATNIEAVGKNNAGNTGTMLLSENELNLWNEIETNLKFFLRDDKSRYTLNKQGGLVIVYATQAEHKKIAEFLHLLYLRVASVAHVVGMVIDCELDEEHPNGIDWNIANTVSNPNQASRLVLRDIMQGIEFLKQFGPMNVLASPNVTIMNNQFAIFQAVRNVPHFKLSIRRSDSAVKHNAKNFVYTPQDIVTSEMSITPVGVVFIVQASIDFTNRSVTLCLKPSVTSVDQTKTDPAVSILSSSNVTSEVPIVKEKSIDTVVNIKDGETVIIGGLIEKEEIPAKIGMQKGTLSLKSRGKRTREMVMLITANIMEPERRYPLSMSECEIFDLEELK